MDLVDKSGFLILIDISSSAHHIPALSIQVGYNVYSCMSSGQGLFFLFLPSVTYHHFCCIHTSLHHQKFQFPEERFLLCFSFTPETNRYDRKQKLNGKQLPEFQVAAPFMGPAGWFMEAEQSGWKTAGCLLK